MLNKPKIKKYLKKSKKLYKEFKGLINHFHLRKIEIAVLLIILFEFLFPQVSLAQEMDKNNYQVPTVMTAGKFLSNNDPDNPSDFNIRNNLPLAETKVPKRTIWVTVTAYSSTPDQTDSTPCITANGFDLCDHNTENVVAANFLPFGSKIKMPDEFGEKVFMVQDRMNARYYYRVDIWMKSRQAARELGVKKVKIEIY